MRVKVLTLFNTGRYYRVWDGQDTHNNLEYSQYRLELFQEITVPSIQNQTCKEFEWHLFTNFQHPHYQKFREICESAHQNCVFHDVCFDRDSEHDFQTELLDTGDVIEIKLDSDDAITYNFIEVISNLPVEYYKVYYPELIYTYNYSSSYIHKTFDKMRNFPIIVKSGNSVNNLYERRHNAYWDIAEEIKGIYYVYTRHEMNHDGRWDIKDKNFIKTLQFTGEEKADIINKNTHLKLRFI